jgi:hypothetical protein
MVMVILGNAVGLAANVASAVHSERAADTWTAASVHLANSEFSEMRAASQLSSSEAQVAASISAVQSFCEVAVLLLIVVAFFVTGLLCVRRVRSMLSGVSAVSAAAAAGKSLHLHIKVTTGFVFVAFLLRSVFSTMCVRSSFMHYIFVTIYTCLRSRTNCKI